MSGSGSGSGLGADSPSAGGNAPLPFETLALVESHSGDVLGEVWLSIWPADPLETQVGEAYDHEAEAEVSAAPLLVRQPNRRIRTDDTLYTVVSCQHNEYVPHLALRLREMRPSG